MFMAQNFLNRDSVDGVDEGKDTDTGQHPPKQVLYLWELLGFLAFHGICGDNNNGLGSSQLWIGSGSWIIGSVRCHDTLGG
jgi:hypothetical protein